LGRERFLQEVRELSDGCFARVRVASRDFWITEQGISLSIKIHKRKNTIHEQSTWVIVKGYTPER